MEFVKIGAIGLIGVLVAIQFKQLKPEYSIYIGFAACVLIFSYICRVLITVAEQISGLSGMFEGEAEYFAILFKVTGITYLCEFCAGVCKDAGFSGIAGQIEVFGKLSVLFAGMPLLLAVIDTIRRFAI